MHLDEIREYCLAKKGVFEDFPFDKDTLVFKVLGKMFALLPLENWESGEASINLKCDPDYAMELRASFESITGGYHMSKKHWNTLSLQSGEIPSHLILELIDHSYDLVVKGMSLKLKRELENL
ncbi:MmcQ/YjbR family DNA-binding protein [Ascidiimonas sp. W6]|uniref:MmcQ/YjbR family DNA-binding protein n=1 Tax=Ascidiimonas meishanensis TaxID=3128903 RepID=UPI0030EEB3B2